LNFLILVQGQIFTPSILAMTDRRLEAIAAYAMSQKNSILFIKD
jgi:hypothetical protein